MWKLDAESKCIVDTFEELLFNKLMDIMSIFFSLTNHHYLRLQLCHFPGYLVN